MRAAKGYGVPNRFKVRKGFWRKLSPLGRKVFNETFESMRDNQLAFLADGEVKRPVRCWRITCWNAAFTAAKATRNARSQKRRK